MVFFLLGLLTCVMIASLFGSEGYNIVDNYISDLGSIRYTPAPLIFDTISMISAFLIIPIFFYSTKLIVSSRSKIFKDSKDFIIFTKILAYIGLVFLLIGACGLFGIGFFSEDRNTQFELHEKFAAIVFNGISVGSFLIGIVNILKGTIKSKIIGIVQFGTPAASILFMIKPEPFTYPFLEWIILFSIFLWMIPIAIFVLKQLKE
ncbi:MAG: hypothetical protein ACTSRI_09705 [Promethearchaeota archaeon]